MPSNRVVHVRSAVEGVAAQSLRAGIARIQAEMEVTPDFPGEVERAAARAAAAPRLPGLDRTDIELVTIDPPGSMDLDQALHLERDGDGYVVHYAIADVAAFVTPGDPVDAEAHRRGETLYGADSKVPLHPPVLSEDAASLLPDQVRPALLWTIRVDATGEGTDVTVERARVRSTARLDYEGAQRLIDDGGATESLRLLAEVGRLRLEREAARGGRVAAAARAGGRRLDDVVASWSTARCSRSRSGTPRSRCSPASARRPSWSTPGWGCCGPCRRRTRATSSGCTARRGRCASTGRPSSSTPTSSARSTPPGPTTPR